MYKKLSLTIMFILSVTAAMISGDVTNAIEYRGLTISPLRNEVTIDPGIAYNGSLEVLNDTDVAMTVNMSAEEFKVSDYDYDYEFIEQSDIASWVSFSPSKIRLKAGEKIQVDYRIGVPISAEPGGRYISLFASTSIASEHDSSIERVASLMYITVTGGDVLGDTSISGEVLSISSPWLVIGNGSTWSANIKNFSATHYRSSYSVTIQDLFGSDVSPVVYGTSLILPDTVRSINGVLPNIDWPGVYKIRYTIGVGSVTSKNFVTYAIILPIWSITLSIFIIFIILLGIYEKHRQKKQKEQEAAGDWREQLLRHNQKKQ